MKMQVSLLCVPEHQLLHWSWCSIKARNKCCKGCPAKSYQEDKTACHLQNNLVLGCRMFPLCFIVSFNLCLFRLGVLAEPLMFCWTSSNEVLNCRLYYGNLHYRWDVLLYWAGSITSNWLLLSAGGWKRWSRTFIIQSHTVWIPDYKYHRAEEPYHTQAKTWPYNVLISQCGYPSLYIGN